MLVGGYVWFRPSVGELTSLRFAGGQHLTVVVDAEGTVALAQYNVRATGHVAKLRRDLGIDQ